MNCLQYSFFVLMDNAIREVEYLFESIFKTINKGRSGCLSSNLLNEHTIETTQRLFLKRLDTTTMKTVTRLELLDTDMSLFYLPSNATLY